MPGSQPPGSSETRLHLTGNALWLVSVSVAFGVLSGTVSVITGLQDHSLGVFAVGLGVLADVAGSAVLIWRFRAERRQPGHSAGKRHGPAVVVAIPGPQAHAMKLGFEKYFLWKARHSYVTLP